MTQTLLNGVFHNFSHQFRNGIPVAGKRTTQIALVKQDGIRGIFSGRILKRLQTALSIKLSQAVNEPFLVLRGPFNDVFDGNSDEMIESFQGFRANWQSAA